MRVSKLAKSMLKYLPILVVLAATVIGLFIGRDLYPASLDSQPKNPLQPPTVLGTIDPCMAVYLTQPPKCKTLDGKFIFLPGASPSLMETPEGN